MRMVYSNFSMFTRDQEHLVSMTHSNGANYVEGSLITNHSPLNNWRSNSFYSPSNQYKILSLLQTKQPLLYSIELVKYYHHQNDHTIDQVHIQIIYIVRIVIWPSDEKYIYTCIIFCRKLSCW